MTTQQYEEDIGRQERDVSDTNDTINAVYMLARKIQAKYHKSSQLSKYYSMSNEQYEFMIHDYNTYR